VAGIFWNISDAYAQTGCTHPEVFKSGWNVLITRMKREIQRASGTTFPGVTSLFLPGCHIIFLEYLA